MISGKTIHIVDTSILLVVLNVQEHYTEEQRVETTTRLKQFYENGDDLLLPIGCIIETGNRIADSKNGKRHPTIKRFLNLIKSAIDRSRNIEDRSKGPFCVMQCNTDELSAMIADFESLALVGTGMADTMCIHYFNEQRVSFPDHRVTIWSYDQDHLDGYDTHPD